MVDSFFHLIGLLFFDISLLYYYIIILILDHQQFSSFNLRWTLILYLSSEGINLSLSISSSFASELFCGEVFEDFVISPGILFLIKIPVGSAIF